MLGPRGIRVDAVAPGVIETDLANFTKTEAGRNLALDMQSLQRMGKPEDVADVIVFLAGSPERAFPLLFIGLAGRGMRSSLRKWDSKARMEFMLRLCLAANKPL